ncbi:MAG: YebC/PmpR family DNA-binding transcriptional regulator [Patescibacteria group bacterium]|nr:YebC/PmpR family DNA-binding transcriptional regulator [Patescibacteria group bacterium]
MSGHNKYSKIKHIKAKTDAQKSKIFTKFGRLITVEAKKANGNINSPGLKAVIDRAREVNMPNDTIERAIKKATADNSASMEAITYESYGYGGCAIIIEVLTDNRNKAAQEIKFILSKHGIALAGIGSATWAFTKTHEGWNANTTIPLSEEDKKKIEILTEDLEENDDVQNVFTNVE